VESAAEVAVNHVDWSRVRIGMFVFALSVGYFLQAWWWM
jgi:hypothetical protein